MLTPEAYNLMPWHKSLIIRFAFLDLISGREQRSIKWLQDHYDELGDDLKALLRTLKQYLAGEDLDVGESATLLRFWRYFLWTVGEERTIIIHATLKTRTVSNDPTLITWSVDQLSDHPEKTSQWSSIAVLLGKRGTRRIKDPHLELSYQAKNIWEQATERGEMWLPQKDTIITRSMERWDAWRQTGVMLMDLKNSEEGCQAVVFGLITPEEMAERWPKSINHESNRPLAMHQALQDPSWINSDDHRVVMAMALLGVPREAFSNPDCVSKSFPFFWEFMVLCGQVSDALDQGE